MYCLVSPPQFVSDDDECIKNQDNQHEEVSGTKSNENLKGRSPEPPLLHIRTCLKGSQAK